MKLTIAMLTAAAVILSGCGPSGPLPIQSMTASGSSVVINFDPNQRSNAQMRTVAREQCKKRGKELKDVTVTKTASDTTSQATVFCR